MQVAIIVVGAVALLFALIKGGASVIGDMLIIVVVVVAFGALYKFAQPHLDQSQQAQTQAFPDLKFFNMYTKIRDAVLAMDFVRAYNDGDFVRLARIVDDFVRGYQELYGAAASQATQASQKIDRMLDRRADILDTIQSFFVSAPNGENDGALRRQLLVVQSITYHMVKKVQQKYGVKRMTFPCAF